jgi:hypothetical protein
MLPLVRRPKEWPKGRGHVFRRVQWLRPPTSDTNSKRSEFPRPRDSRETCRHKNQQNAAQRG